MEIKTDTSAPKRDIEINTDIDANVREQIKHIADLTRASTTGNIKETVNALLHALAGQSSTDLSAVYEPVHVDPESTYMDPKIKSKKELISWCLIHLGYPLLTVELTEEHFNVAIADALTLYSKYASFPPKYIALGLGKYDEDYDLSGGPTGLDLSEWNVADVKEVITRGDRFYGNGNEDILFGWPAFMNGQFGGMPYFGSSNSMGQNWSGGFITYHNFHEFMDLSRRMAGSNPDWRYNKYTKHLNLIPHPKPAEIKNNEPIMIEAECEPAIEELYTEEYFRRIVLAYCKIMLGTIRSKFGSVQLIGGGNINTDIGQEGKEELNNIIENILRDTSIGQECYIY